MKYITHISIVSILVCGFVGIALPASAATSAQLQTRLNSISELIASIKSKMTGGQVLGVTTATPDACMDTSGPLEVVIGTYDSGRFSPETADNKKFDARDAAFIHSDDFSWQMVDLRGSSQDMCWVGGYHTNDQSWHPLDASWDLSKTGIVEDGETLGGRNTTAVISYGDGITWSGLHTFNTHDPVRTSKANDWTIQHSWLEYSRDDCLENDVPHSGTIYDSLLDGCYVGFSSKLSDSDSGLAGQVVNLDKVLVRLEPMPEPYKWDSKYTEDWLYIDGVAFGHGKMFKMGGAEHPTYNVTNSVFLHEFDNPDNNHFPDPEHVGTCENNTILWLDGPDTAPYYLEDDFPGCFTIITDEQAALDFWATKVVDWHERHPNVGADRKPARPGCYEWPRFGDTRYLQCGNVDGSEAETDPVLGCTDPTADNYNDAATEDDSSCAYPPEPADSDEDGVADSVDNCPITANTNQADTDNDGVGDMCDSTPGTSGESAIEVQVSTYTDDAEEKVSGGRVDLDSSDLELAFDSSTEQLIGIRFQDLDIPQGAEITNAYIQFTTDETSSERTELTIKIQAADDADTFASENGNISDRPLHTAAVSWTPQSWDTRGESGAVQETPNISSLVQSVISRGGWSAGHAMVFVISGDGSRIAESYDGSSSQAPVLYVAYTLDGGLADSDQSITAPSLNPVSVTSINEIDDDPELAPAAEEAIQVEENGRNDDEIFSLSHQTDSSVERTATPVATLATTNRLRTTDNLNVRTTPGGALVRVVANGTTGTKTTDDPVQQGGYTWIRVDFAGGVSGWVAENFTRPDTATTVSTERRTQIFTQIQQLLAQIVTLQERLREMRGN